jgi:hypothetical protein
MADRPIHQEFVLGEYQLVVDQDVYTKEWTVKVALNGNTVETSGTNLAQAILVTFDKLLVGEFSFGI